VTARRSHHEGRDARAVRCGVWLQGYDEGFNYFYIKAEKVEQVDTVGAPRLSEPVDKN
jgi:hypothetical protein